MDFKNENLFKRFIKFGIVGFSGIIVNQGMLYYFHGMLHIASFLASPLAIILAIFNNFSWNDIWTWAHNRKNRKHSYGHRLIRYYVSASLGALINYITLLSLEHVFHVHYLVANLIGIGLGMISNFLFGEFWVFKSHRQNSSL